MSVEQNNDLYDAVVAGDAVAKEAMIVGNRGLVVVKADALIRKIPSVAYLRDDLVSAGNIGLVRAVKRLTRRVRRAAVNAWIGRCVSKEMLDLLPHEHTVYVPGRSSALAYNNNRPIDPPRVINALPETLEAYSDCRIVELRDLFSVCCQTDTERLCFRLREEGHTYSEIAEQVGLAVSTVYTTLTRLKQRILNAWHDND